MRQDDHRGIQTWIFVTGLPRSGTTFVGRVLSLPVSVDYLHEPFNPSCGIPELAQDSLYLRPDDLTNPQAARYHDTIARMLRYEMRFKTVFYPQDARLKRIAKRFLGGRSNVRLQLTRLNPFHRASVIKDPTAFLLTDFLSHHFGVKPVIVVRHPVAVVASWQKLGWQPHLARWVEQETLAEDYLIDEYALLTKDWKHPIEQIAVLWRVAHKVLLRQAARHPSWRLVTHEALCAEPLRCFRTLYETLHLPWTTYVKHRIRTWTSLDNPVEARTGKLHDLRRNSQSLLHLRREALSPTQRSAIYDIVAEVAASFYDRESFGLD